MIGTKRSDGQDGMGQVNSAVGWTKATVDRHARWRLLGQSGAVVWLTGLSGSGKSTLAVALDARLHQAARFSCILDGDNLRRGLCKDLDFSHVGRTENIRRTAEAAKLLAESGLVAICSLISPYEDDRLQARSTCEQAGLHFIEVYVNAPLETCERRDPRGLYRRARSGEIPQFTGIDSPYESPTSCELELRTDRESIAVCVEQLVEYVLARIRM